MNGSGMRLAIQWCALAGGLLGSQTTLAQVYDLAKVVATGDAVPGLEETFRYFVGVHIFEDGSVAMGGVTTRTGFFERGRPTGLYHAFPAGSLQTVAQMNWEDAWRDIGLPHTLMDSNQNKVFAFDRFLALPEDFNAVISTKTLSDPIQSLTPEDTSTVSLASGAGGSGVTNGRFGTLNLPLKGLAINAANQVLFSFSMGYGEFFDTVVDGLFVGTSAEDLRNVAFEGDNAPGITNATFETFHSIHLADDGTIFFSSRLFGTGAPSGANDSLWMEKNGDLSLILREGDNAPGIPDRVIVLSGNLNLIHLDQKGSHTVFTGGVGGGGDPVFRGIWLGSTTPGTPELMARVDSTPNLNDSSIFVSTDRGNLVFTSVDFNSVQLDSSGNVFFDAAGKSPSDASLSGIWKFNRSDGTFSTVVPFDFASGFTNIELLAANDNGDVAFLARDQGAIDGLYVRLANGQYVNVAFVGDTLDGRIVNSFASRSSMALQSKILGDLRYHNILTNSGDLVFVARFDDADGDGVSDQGVYTATLNLPVTTRYLWTGNAGNSDGSLASNWQDLDTLTTASREPGSASGTETVRIDNADVTLAGLEVHLKSLDASGSLITGTSLMLEEASSAQSVDFRGSFSTKADFSLSGQSIWREGNWSGNGGVSLLVEATLQIGDDPTPGPLGLETPLRLSGKATAANGLELTLNPPARMEIRENGVLVGRRGLIQHAEGFSGFGIENKGSIQVLGSNGAGDIFTIDTPLNNLGGTLNVGTGNLRLTEPVEFRGGVVNVDSLATLSFQATPGQDPPGNQLTILQDTLFEGGGEISLSSYEMNIASNATVTTDMTPATGGFTINGESRLHGEGTLANNGRLVVENSLLDSSVENEGVLLFRKAEGLVPASFLRDAQLTNNGLVIQNAPLVVVRESSTTPIEMITNHGTFQLEDEALLFSGSSARFDNRSDGLLVKRGDGLARVDMPYTTSGRTQVVSGELRFNRNTVWGNDPIGTSLLEVEAGARLKLMPGESTEYLPQNHRLQSPMRVVGNGELLVSDSILAFAEGASLTNAGATVTIEQSVELREASITNESGTLILSGQSSAEDLKFAKPLYNMSGGKLIMEGTLQPYVVGIINEGETVVKSPGVRIFRLYKPELPSAEFINKGYLRVEPQEISGSLSESSLEPEFSFGDNRDEWGTVEVVNGARIRIRPAQALLKRRFPSSYTASLKQGSWVIDPESFVGFDGGFDIDHIQSGVEVWLKGSGTDLINPARQFENLPQSVTHFLNEGVLTLENNTFIARQNFKNTGTVAGRPGTVLVKEPGVFYNEAKLAGSLEIIGTLVDNAKTSPGESPGSLVVTGDYIQGVNGELIMELGGNGDPSRFDRLTVSGNAHLQGSLIIRTMEEDLPADRTAFRVLQAGSISGNFREVLLETNSGRIAVEVVTDATGVVVETEVLQMSSFSQWTSALFSAEQLADPLISGPDADPDQDKIVNLMEYLLDGHPLRDNTGLISLSVQYSEAGDPERMEVTFPWANDANDFAYKLEISTNLSSWQEAQTQLTSETVSSTVTRRTFSIPLAGGPDAAYFLRLRASPN